MRHFLTLTLLLVVFMGGEVKASSSFDDEDYTRYRNTRFQFSLLVPKYWRREVTDLDYKHIITLRKGRHGIIKITSTGADPQELRRYDTIRDWYLTSIGRRVNKIVETGNVSINRGITGRLYIIEFSKRRKRLLRRILITRYNNKILVVECGTTVRQFYNYSEIFNNVMGSIIFNEKIITPEEQEKEIYKKKDSVEEKTEPVKKDKVKPLPSKKITPPSEIKIKNKTVPAKKGDTNWLESKKTAEEKTEPVKKSEPAKKEKKKPVVRNTAEDTPKHVAPIEENPAVKKEFENLDKLMEEY